MIRKTTIFIGVLLFGVTISLPMALFLGCVVAYSSFVHLWRGLFDIINEQCCDKVSHSVSEESVWEKHQKRLDETARKENNK